MTLEDISIPKYAGFWRRFGAILIDLLVTSPYFLLSQDVSLDKWAAVFLLPFFLFLNVFYDIIFLGWRSRTPGMMVMRIKVVHPDLSRVRWGGAFIRSSVDLLIQGANFSILIVLFVLASPNVFNASFFEINKYFFRSGGATDSFLDFLLQVAIWWLFIDSIVFLLNRQKRAAHDFLANTIVVCVDRNLNVLSEEQGEVTLFADFVSKILGFLLIFALILLVMLDAQKRFFPQKKTGDSVVGIREGNGFLTSSVLTKGAWITAVRDMTVNPSDPRSFLIGTGDSVFSLENDGVVSGLIKLPWGIHGAVWAVSPHAANLVVANRLGGRPALMTASGKMIWSLSDVQSATCFSDGPILGNGQTQLAVGFKNGDLELLDENGKAVWRHSEKRLLDLETTDNHGKGPSEIIGSAENNNFYVWDSMGAPVTEFQSPVSLKGFSVLPWQGGKDRGVVLLPDDKQYMIYSLETGVPITEWNTGFSRVRYPLKEVWVNWDSKKDKSLVVLATLGFKRTGLTVFNPWGNIQYREVLGRECSALAVVADPNTGGQDLLCGCDGEIIKYQKTP